MCTEFAVLSWGRQGPTALQVVEGKVPEVRGELGQRQETPGQHVPEEPGAGAVWEQPVLDDLPERCSQHPGCDPGSWGEGSGGAHLQRGVHDLVDGGEVGVPQELGLLLESQHPLRVDAADDGGDLRWQGASRVLTLSPCPDTPARLLWHPYAILRDTPWPRVLCHLPLWLCHLLSLEQDLAQEPQGLWVWEMLNTPLS